MNYIVRIFFFIVTTTIIVITTSKLYNFIINIILIFNV